MSDFITNAELRIEAERLCDENDQLKTEISELRKTLGEYECKMDTLVDSLTGGLLSKSMDTPNDSIEDAVREHVEGNLATENARLRELADAVKEFVHGTYCEDCPCRRDCDDNNRIFCADDFSYHVFAAMRELGIEVDCRD